jgi:putative serine protease PepD
VLAAVLAAGGTAGVVTALHDGSSSSGLTSSTSTNDRSSAPQVPVSGDQVDWSKVAAAVEPSVVSIRVRSQMGAGEGSGMVLDTEGHVLTNNHVVAAAGSGGQMQVAFSDGTLFDAEVVGTDPTTDLAVIKIVDPPKDLTPVQFADSDSVDVGQPVMALGNPLGLSDTVTTGIVSAVDRPVTTQGEGSSPFQQGEPVVTNAIQTDAAVNPGNSGGPLVDASGRVIGVNSAIASVGANGAGSQSGSIGLGFAIPSIEAQRVAKELLTDGQAQHAFLGVSLKDVVVQADGVHHQAAGIVQVVDGSPAAGAGLKAGDAVTAVDGEAVSGAESLTAQVRERAPGSKAELTVVRDGKTEKVSVTLEAKSGS